MGKTEELVRPVAEKVAAEQGLEIYDIEYKKEGKDFYLRIFVDKENIGVNDCEAFSRAISPILDREDPIPDNYILEISSPGMFRKLKTEAHFARYMGEQVEVKLFKSEGGVKKICGTLEGYDGGTVTVDDGEKKVSVDKENYMYVKLNPKCF